MEARIRFNRSEGFIVFRSSSYNREKSVRTTVHHRYQQCCEMYFGTGTFCPDLNQNFFSCVRIWIGLKIRIHKNAQVQEEEEEMFLSYFSTLCQVPPKPNQRTSFRSISSGKKLKLKLKQKTDRSKSRFLKSGYGSAKKTRIRNTGCESGSDPIRNFSRRMGIICFCSGIICFGSGSGKNERAEQLKISGNF